MAGGAGVGGAGVSGAGVSGGGIYSVSNPLEIYGSPDFLFDTVYSQYRNGRSGGLFTNFSSLTGLTFTRASTKYVQNNAGLLLPVASGVPAISDKGLLIEGARTNLCLRSQEFDNASWTKAACVVTADQYTAPDGTTTMDRLTCSSGSAAHYVSQNITWTAAVYCVSYFVTYVNHQYFQITTWDGTTSRYMNFDILNGTVGTGGNASGLIFPVSGGYRCVMISSTSHAAAAGNTTAAFSNSSSASANPTFTAAGTEIIGIWGAQAE